jgi:Protein of unknown function (DUF732)
LIPLALVAVVSAASVAVLLSGCASSDDLLTTAAPPTDGTTATSAGQSNNIVVTTQQRAYLDALAKAGVHRSNDLMALSIGSYVCQAKAAGQGEQAVWDFVFPLVRGDVHDMNPDATATAMAPQVHDATAEYIRIATERLCAAEPGDHSP